MNWQNSYWKIQFCVHNDQGWVVFFCFIFGLHAENLKYSFKGNAGRVENMRILNQMCMFEFKLHHLQNCDVWYFILLRPSVNTSFICKFRGKSLPQDSWGIKKNLCRYFPQQAMWQGAVIEETIHPPGSIYNLWHLYSFATTQIPCSIAFSELWCPTFQTLRKCALGSPFLPINNFSNVTAPPSPWSCALSFSPRHPSQEFSLPLLNPPNILVLSFNEKLKTWLSNQYNMNTVSKISYISLINE